MRKVPEVVEVQIQTEGLAERLIGDSFKGIRFEDRGYKIIRPVEEDDFIGLVNKQKIISIFRRGKFIVIELSNGLYLSTHLRMTGRFTVDVPESEVGHTRIVFTMKSGKELRYSDVRIFGRMYLIENLEVLDKGLDAFSVTHTEIYKQLKKKQKAHGSKTVKAFMNDQKVICGLGNVYCNELLFRVGIYPGKLVKNLSDEDLEKLAINTKNVLQWGYGYGGLSLRDYFHVDGSKGSTQLYLSVYQNDRCHRCTRKIYKSEEFDGRATYFCKHCQQS